MKNIILSILVFLISFIGFTFTSMQIYASPDGNSYPFNGSIIYFGTSVFLFIFLYTLDYNMHKSLKWINILIVASFSIIGLFLTLTCLYALPVKGQVEPLASAIFLLSSMIAISSIFFLLRKYKSNPNLEKT